LRIACLSHKFTFPELSPELIVIVPDLGFFHRTTLNAATPSALIDFSAPISIEIFLIKSRYTSICSASSRDESFSIFLYFKSIY
jgi:hypothetical protein